MLLQAFTTVVMSGSPTDPLNLADVPNERPSAEASVDTASARRSGKGKHLKRGSIAVRPQMNKLRSAVSETIQRVLRRAEVEGPSTDPQHSQSDEKFRSAVSQTIKYI